MSEIKQLTPQQLGCFLQKLVQVGDNPNQRGVLASVNTMYCEVTYAKGRGQHWHRDVAIRPVLRLPTDVTNDEWVAYFGDIFVITQAEEGDYVQFRYPNESKPFLTIWNDGDIGCDEMLPYASLIDYMRSISVDTNNWIEKGLAVHKQMP